MADVKITALTAISANPVNPATFPIPMVDLLDNTITASGTTKKVTVNQILGAGGTATLASATITGAATVGTTLGVTGVSTLASAVVTGALTSGTTTLVSHAAGYTGKVGIGTATPSQALHVRGNILTASAAGTDSYVNVTTDGVQNSFFGFNNSGSTNGSGASNNNTYIGSGNNYPVQIITNGALVATFSTAAVTLANHNLVMATSGTGIDFAATSSVGTSELLNDYEEGTWTIVINDQLGNSATIASQIARYVKIGRRVSVFGDFTLSAKGSAGGGSLVYLGALPFLPVSTCFEGGVVHRYDNTNLTTNGQINIMSAAGGNTVCLFPVSSATTGTSFLTFTQITNTTRFVFNFSYDV